jgi:FkbM family methyltransferase
VVRLLTKSLSSLLSICFRLCIFLQLKLEKIKLHAHAIGQRLDGSSRLIVGKSYIDWSKLLGEKAQIVEVGAFDGRDTMNFARIFPKGRILSFEPDSQLFVDATTNLRTFDNVEMFPFAVSDRFETVNFFASSGTSRASGSLRKPTEHLRLYPDVSFGISAQFPVIAVDLNGFLKTRMDRIDLLWIDAQGHELSVLKGATNFLGSISFIFCEVANIPLYEGSPVFKEIADFLSSYEFEILDSDITFNDKDGTGNALFIRRKID